MGRAWHLRRRRAASVAAGTAGLDEQLTDLEAALAALEMSQQVTQQADNKAALLVAIEVGTVAIVTSRVAILGDTEFSTPLGVTLWVLFAAWIVAFLVSGHALVQLVLPRHAHLPPHNRFGLGYRSGCASTPTHRASPSQEAWEAAHAVGTIAHRKNRLAKTATYSVAGVVAVSATWLAASQSITL